MNTIALTLLLSALPVLTQEPETERLRKDVERLKADNDVLSRQLDLYMAYLRDFSTRLSKEKLEKGAADRLAQDLAMLEENHVDMARQKKRLEDRLLAEKSVRLQYGADKGITGKVSAVSESIGLVVIAVGADQGVQVGNEFTVTRRQEEVALIRIDRVDPKWAAGKVVWQTGPPRVADDVVRSNPKPLLPVVPSRPAAPLKAAAADEVQSLRKELDEVRNQVRQLTDKLLPAYQGAGVSVEEAAEPLREHLAIQRGLVVRRIREGSPAEKAGLKANDVVPDLLEPQLVEALESGKPIDIIRQGAKQRLTGR